MVIIWRGAGILIPILLGISCWITSYSFDDTRLGNGSYMGWSMIWAGIPILLIGGLLAASNLPEAENEDDEQDPELEQDEVVPAGKSHNDLFWIPMWIWGAFFIGFGIYL